MSRKEVDRLEVIQAVVGKRLKQREAAGQLGLRVRQVKRWSPLPGAGARGAGLPPPGGAATIRFRGRPRIRPGLVRERYADFGRPWPARSCGSATAIVSVETLRQWMITQGAGNPAGADTPASINAGPAAPASASWCRSMAHPTPGSRREARGAP